MDCRLIPHRLLAAGALMRRGFHVAAAHRCASVLPKHCFQRIIALLLHAEKATIGAQKLCFDAPICNSNRIFFTTRPALFSNGHTPSECVLPFFPVRI